MTLRVTAAIGYGIVGNSKYLIYEKIKTQNTKCGYNTPVIFFHRHIVQFRIDAEKHVFINMYGS